MEMGKNEGHSQLKLTNANVAEAILLKIGSFV